MNAMDKVSESAKAAYTKDYILEVSAYSVVEGQRRKNKQN